MQGTDKFCILLEKGKQETFYHCSWCHLHGLTINPMFMACSRQTQLKDIEKDCDNFCWRDHYRFLQDKFTPEVSGSGFHMHPQITWACLYVFGDHLVRWPSNVYDQSKALHLYRAEVQSLEPVTAHLCCPNHNPSIRIFSFCLWHFLYEMTISTSWKIIVMMINYTEKAGKVFLPLATKVITLLCLMVKWMLDANINATLLIAHWGAVALLIKS